MRSFFRVGAPLIVVLATATGCNDSTGFDLSPLLVTDTVVIAAPIAGNEDLPTALDITGDGAGGVFGGRFPERPLDALKWDFAVRIRNGQLALVPSSLIGIPSRAAVTPPLAESFEGLREAPEGGSFVTSEAMPLTRGSVYAARSREDVSIYGTVCSQFSKLTPLDVNLATGRVEIAIVTNQRCGDPRLVPDE